MAATIDARIEEVWRDHPRRFFVDSRPDFQLKAAETLRRLRDELPPCCGAQLTQRPLAVVAAG